MKKLLALAVVILGFTAVSFGQASATATATAIIVTPITITNAADMNFGNVASSATAGTVILAPDGSRTRTLGVTLPAVTGSPSAASFNITGNAGYVYSITLPSAATNLSSGASPVMTADTWTSVTLPLLSTLDASGKGNIKVGAILHVAASQPGGTYVSGTPFTVTVNYN